MDRRKFLQKFGLGASGVAAATVAGPGMFETFWNWLASLMPRKLKAAWGLEAAQDLAGFHGIEMDNLIALMAKDIRQEIDREIIESLT